MSQIIQGLTSNTPQQQPITLPDGERIDFMDGRCGAQSFEAGRDFGDFVVWRRDGVPAYELVVAADDHAMAITEVARPEWV